MSERRALLGGAAMSAAQILKYGLQLIVLPILARLLGPEAFGVVGLAMPFILLANMLSDAGKQVPRSKPRPTSCDARVTRWQKPPKSKRA
jgi:O-antigen/teichoic acid export membrane protein